jgi:hypothetical protein
MLGQFIKRHGVRLMQTRHICELIQLWVRLSARLVCTDSLNLHSLRDR